MIIKAIVAINKLGYIGLDGGLPWRCSEDLKWFKQKTMGSKLVVGYNTFKTLPELKGRVLLLDSRGSLREDGDWIIGGAKTYIKYQHLIKEWHISIINDYTLGDVKFPFSEIEFSNVYIKNFEK